jgi:hypothetical protein
MKTQIWQACFLSDPEPNRGDGGVTFTRQGVGEDPNHKIYNIGQTNVCIQNEFK